MDRRASLRTLATSLPLLLLVALVSLGRGGPTPHAEPALPPTATSALQATATPGHGAALFLWPSRQAPGPVEAAAATSIGGAVLPPSAAPAVAPATRTPPSTRTPSPTRTPSCTRTPSPTRTPSATRTPSPTRTPSATRTPSPTRTDTPTATPSPTPTPPSPAASVLRITALEYAGADEYVEITNQGPVDELMTGWQLASGGQKTPFAFPNGYVLPVGAGVRVHSGRDAVDSPPADLKWSGTYFWNNDGDEAHLYDAAGNLVDSWVY